jgi:DNA-binding MarR family transcriptional regulator
MSALTQQADAGNSLWERYRDNFSRHVIGVSRHLQRRMMQTLHDECGHTDLRLGFAPYIMLVGDGGCRLSDLAENLSISRQACNQAVKQIELAGYIARTADPADGRARQLVLTQRGKQLRRDGMRVVRTVDQQFIDIAGERTVSSAAASLGKIYNGLSLSLGDDGAQTLYGGLGGLLPRLSDYVLQRIMELTRDRGHPGLKLSFGQVLTLIGPDGGRIQQMAAIQDISKQAISAIASELESQGYLRREQDPGDARQVVLYFTERGVELITDSVASVADLEQEFAAIVGRPALAQLSETLRTLYQALCLEQEVFENGGNGEIGLLATQLRQRLGEQASQALGRLLLNQTPMN